MSPITKNFLVKFYCWMHRFNNSRTTVLFEQKHRLIAIRRNTNWMLSKPRPGQAQLSQSMREGWKPGCKICKLTNFQGSHLGLNPPLPLPGGGNLFGELSIGPPGISSGPSSLFNPCSSSLILMPRQVFSNKTKWRRASPFAFGGLNHVAWLLNQSIIH